MTIASFDLRSPTPIAAFAAGFPFLAGTAAAPSDAAREEQEEHRWQLEWERRNVED
jgi:hypothetical protein